MTRLAKVVSAVALIGTIAPPLAFVAGAISLSSMQTWMLMATAAWFVATPFWMDR